MTPEEIVAAARQTTGSLIPSQPVIDKLLAQLADDDDLEAAVELAMWQCKRFETITLFLAAIVRGRPCRAKLLGRAMWFLPLELMAAVVVHTPGDQLGALVAAIRSDRLDEEQTLHAIGLAITINGDGPLDPRLNRALRRTARSTLSAPTRAMFGSLIADVADPSLRTIAADHIDLAAMLGRKSHKSKLEPIRRARFYDLLPTSSAAARRLTGGVPIRHAPQVGRNEPCPCGSGRKFKKCCIEAHELASDEASPVPGLTILEYTRQAHRHLDAEGLCTLSPFDLARLPFDELDASQLTSVFFALVLGGLLEPAQRALAALDAQDGARIELVELLDSEILATARSEGDAGPLRRSLAGDPAARRPVTLAELGLVEPNEGLDAIEASLAESLRVLDGDDTRAQVTATNDIGLLIQMAVLHRPGLGLLLARGALASRTEPNLDRLLRAIDHARDELDLRPRDPIRDYLDDLNKDVVDAGADDLLAAMRKENERLADEAETALAALRNARGQSRRNRTRLEAARKELRGLEDELDVVTAPDPRIAGLQATVSELECKALELEDDKQTLKNRLNEMQQEFAARVPAPPTPPAEGDELFDHDATPPTFVEVLVPEWSHAARADLHELDAPVAAHTLDVVARVASGRAGEGSRVKKLKGRGDLWSARVGIGHRVLFRFDAGERVLRIVHVTPRKDLEKVLRGI